MRIHKKYKPLWTADYDYAVITGGRGSGKSFAVGDFIENLSFERGHTILSTRYTLTSAHLSVIPEFQEKIELEDHTSVFDIGKTEVRNKQSNVPILFRGIKTSSGIQTAALKSIVGLSTWVVEEAEELTDPDVFDKIDESVRQLGVKNRTILVLNPASKEHWIYKRFFEDAGIQAGWNGIKNRVLYIHTTYLDNIENLSEKFLNKVEQLKINNPVKYKHRILGGWLDRADGVIYENWSLGEFNDDIQSLYGLDFGFSIDPDALIKVAIDRKRKQIYVKQLIYKTGNSTDQLIDLLKLHVKRNEVIMADSSEGRLIGDIRKAQFNIKPTKKPHGSVNEGIKTIQDYQLIVDPDSPDIIRELNNYAWHDKKSQMPIDAWNHLLDALRYAVMFKLGPSGKYYVQ